MTAGGKSLPTLAGSLVLFGLAGSVVAATVPFLFAGPGRPPFAVFLVGGVAAIVLTAGLFALVGRLGMGFGKTALALAGGYNALIAAVKLGLAPAALYEANSEKAFDALGGDPNNPIFYAGVGLATLVLYLLVFWAMYRFFRARFRRRAASRASESRTEAAESRPANWGVLAVSVAATLVVLAGVALWWVPMFFVALPTLSYLTYLFTTFGASITLALSLAAVLAYKTFEEVEERAVRLGDATLLASFFWFGLTLILVYHVMWAVFLLTLVSIWPFRTYTPK